MKGAHYFQIIKCSRYNFSTFKERIDTLLSVFEESVRETRRVLQENGFSRRHFLCETSGNARIRTSFQAESEKLRMEILSRVDELNEFEFSKSILSLGSVYRWKDAESVFRIAKLKFPHCSDIDSAMIYAYGKIGKYSSALMVFEEASRRKQINYKMFEALIEAYSVHAERQILDANVTDTDSLEVSNNPVYRQAHSERITNEISLDPVLRTYQQMIQLNFIPRISTITRIIRLAGRLRRFGAIENMLRECERLNIKFDTRAYEVLMFAQMQCGRSDEAEETLRRALQQFGYDSVDSPRFLNVMLFGYCRLKRPLEANRLVKQFSAVGVEPNCSALSFLVGTAAKCGFVLDARELFVKLSQALKSSSSADNSLRTPAANNLLSAYLRESDYDSFYALLDELDGEPPAFFSRDRYTNVMVFDALNRSRNPERLRSEIERIKVHLNQNSKVSPMELSALFRCLFTHFNGDEALLREFIDYLQSQIRDRNDESGKRELRMILLDVFSKLGEWEKCVELVEMILLEHSRTTLAVDPAVFAKLMLAAGPNSHNIEFVFAWMDRVKCWRDPAILVSAMDLYLQADCLEPIRILWEEEVKIRRNRAKTLSVAISIMARVFLLEEGPISALIHLNNYRSLWDNVSVQVYLKASRLSNTLGSLEAEGFFFERIHKSNPPPNVDVCNEIIPFVVNRPDSLKRVVDWMCESGCHPNVQTVNILLSVGSASESAKDAFDAAQRLVEGMMRAGANPSDELLLRMISGHLERSGKLNDAFHSKAEVFSNHLNQRQEQVTPQHHLNLYRLWQVYYSKHGRQDKLDQLQQEIEKLPLEAFEGSGSRDYCMARNRLN
jgi:pentatricopeptide repeat protein